MRDFWAILAFKTAPEEVCHHSKTEEDTILNLRSYGELGLELPTQVESKIERKSEQNSFHDLLVISALQRLENTEAGQAPKIQHPWGFVCIAPRQRRQSG